MQDKNSENFRNIAFYLLSARHKAGLSQSELAKKLGFSSPMIVSRFERGERIPNVETLKKYAELFPNDLDLHWLITGSYSYKYTEVLNNLKPFIQSYESDLISKIQKLEERKRNLMKNGNSDNLEKIISEIDDLQRWYKLLNLAIGTYFRSTMPNSK